VDGTLKSAPHYKEKSRLWVSIKPFAGQTSAALLPLEAVALAAKPDVLHKI
jgi:hypothetical protein